MINKMFVLGLLAVVLLVSTVSGAAASTLTEAVSKSGGVSDAEAGEHVKLVFAAISSELAAGREVSIRNFGKFYIQARDARSGVNPKSGEKIQIPAKKYPKFRSSNNLKAALNK